ncbi:patatin-like phospholipase family protein [Alteromonas sp. 5E99-2]|uniref:patatin-like phospholipase family protein n=1 Tax=Alteromonas sp. 5E99-2 TaxID=2817683 RepID=UPI001A9A02EF|nr:patatin-like phospholipase family protein [Alteromonas sp. 5E99-2]MBO1254884.1 patatin-like phospholipase family protein [Alteromonas sp. 5E99-2]
MPPLNIFAGPKAIQRMKVEPFGPNLFTQFLGASGGPKWFVLAGLDKALFGEFFVRHCGHMNIIGSSAGAFRAACFAQADPAAAIDRLSSRYAKTVFSDRGSSYEVSEKARELVSYVVPTDGVLEIMNNDTFTVHFITSRCKGWMASNNKVFQGAALLLSASLNKLSRRNLKYFFDRVVFSPNENKLRISDPYDIPTEQIKMGYNTVHQALLASGSIPMLMESVRDVVDAPDDFYRDGGIIDYHFDLGLAPARGLTLYPHFSTSPVAGWFDKGNPNRRPHAQNYDNVVMLVPSDEFVKSLPYGKIPDRKDFKSMADKERIHYWQKVISESERLGDYFLEQVSEQKILDVVKPLPFVGI